MHWRNLHCPAWTNKIRLSVKMCCVQLHWCSLLSFYNGIFTQFLSSGLMLILLLSRATGSPKASPQVWKFLTLTPLLVVFTFIKLWWCATYINIISHHHHSATLIVNISFIYQYLLFFGQNQVSLEDDMDEQEEQYFSKQLDHYIVL